MSRYEAYIQAGWEMQGMANVFVARHRPDGSVDHAVFLVDLYCLGVKDVICELGGSPAEFREFFDHRYPPEFKHPFEPAAAKKMIEGAVAYAESLGFAPHRDYRKARKVLSGIDASTCDRTFTFGRDGKPCFIKGSDDSVDRVERVLGMLEARFGPDGFTYEVSDDYDDDDETEGVDSRRDLMEFLEDEPDDVPRFFWVNGLITAMLISPKPVSPLEVGKAIWGEQGRRWESAEEAKYFHETLFAYWNEWVAGLDEVLAPDAPPESSVIDLWADDLPEGDAEAAAAAMVSIEWCGGFLQATALWPEGWKEVRSRPDLAGHWEILEGWAGFMDAEKREKVIAASDATPPRTLNSAVKAIARAVGSRTK